MGGGAVGGVSGGTAGGVSGKVSYETIKVWFMKEGIRVRECEACWRGFKFGSASARGADYPNSGGDSIGVNVLEFMWGVLASKPGMSAGKSGGGKRIFIFRCFVLSISFIFRSFVTVFVVVAIISYIHHQLHNFSNIHCLPLSPSGSPNHVSIARATALIRYYGDCDSTKISAHALRQLDPTADIGHITSTEVDLHAFMTSRVDSVNVFRLNPLGGEMRGK